jgi:ferredoxin
MPKITLVKQKKTIECPSGANLREVLLAQGFEVYSGLDKKLNCRGHGLCGTCRVYIKEGTKNAAAPTFKERLKAALAFWSIDHEDEVRLSCQTKVMGDMTVETTPELNLYGVDSFKYTTRPPFGSVVGSD